jgi:outer membrane lipoprotein LolB
VTVRAVRLAAIALALALTGCAHMPAGDDGLDAAARRDRLESMTAWEMRGRLAVDAAGKGYQARFRWRQDNDRLMLSVSGPLGAGGVEIDGTDRALTVRARGESWQLTDPETQLSDLLGWWMPVTSLKDWLLGLPDAAHVAEPVFDAKGRLAALEQRLWRLDYPEYQLAGSVAVPRTIEMAHDALSLRLTVDSLTPLKGSTAP